MNEKLVIKTKNPEKYEHLIKNGIDSFVAWLLYNRGITDIKEAEKFLYGNENDLYDPFLIKEMKRVCKIITEAIEKQRKIFIFGDYDVDGITATAILYMALKDLCADVHYYLPDRLTEGYGMSMGAVEKLHQEKCEIIITVDNGIKCFDEVRLARNYGMDVVILDHHIPSNELPDANAVIDLHCEGETYPYKELAGCGIAFKVACCLYDYYGLKGEGLKYLDLVAIGTIADVVPLTGENRILVKEGLKYINNPNYNRIGIIELINSFGITPGTLRASDISFKIVPALNAPGRLYKKGAEMALRLLLCNSDVEAIDMAYELFSINEERKHITDESLAKAEEYIYRENLDKDKVIVVFVPDIPEGIVGLVSGKITEKYNRPSIVFCEKSDCYKASARSIEKFNLIKALDSCNDLFIKYGGHALAAGMIVGSEENIYKLRKAINKYADAVLDEADLESKIYVDDVLNENDISFDLIKKLDLLEPYGVGNPKPVFLVQGYTTQKRQYNGGWLPYLYMGTNENHLKLFGVNTEAVGFGMVDKFEELGQPRRLDIVCTLSVNNFRGHSTIQLEMLDFDVADICSKPKTELMKAMDTAIRNMLLFNA